jgi:hypothetical protein
MLFTVGDKTNLGFVTCITEMPSFPTLEGDHLREFSTRCAFFIRFLLDIFFLNPDIHAEIFFPILNSPILELSA